MNPRRQKIEQCQWQPVIELARVTSSAPGPFSMSREPEPFTLSLETVEPIELAYQVLPGLHFRARLVAYIDNDDEPVILFMGDPAIEALAHARRGQTEAELLQTQEELRQERAKARRRWQERQDEAKQTRGRQDCQRLLGRLGAHLGW